MARVAIGLGLTAAIALPALRVWQFDGRSHAAGADNRALLALVAQAARGAPVVVDEALADVDWRFGGHPRRAVEYYLTLGGVDYERADQAKIHHYLTEDRNLTLFLADGTAAALAATGLRQVAAAGSGWGLYESP
jgi:hypothetical protein